MCHNTASFALKSLRFTYSTRARTTVPTKGELPLDTYRNRTYLDRYGSHFQKDLLPVPTICRWTGTRVSTRLDTIVSTSR
jgi:hypothetical protein